MNLTLRERIALEYLDCRLSACGWRVGMQIWINDRSPGLSRDQGYVGAAVCGKLRRMGLVTRLSDIAEWRITSAGRAAIKEKQ